MAPSLIQIHVYEGSSLLDFSDALTMRAGLRRNHSALIASLAQSSELDETSLGYLTITDGTRGVEGRATPHLPSVEGVLSRERLSMLSRSLSREDRANVSRLRCGHCPRMLAQGDVSRRYEGGWVRAWPIPIARWGLRLISLSGSLAGVLQQPVLGPTQSLQSNPALNTLSALAAPSQHCARPCSASLP